MTYFLKSMEKLLKYSPFVIEIIFFLYQNHLTGKIDLLLLSNPTHSLRVSCPESKMIPLF